MSDIEGIWGYIAAHSFEAADRWMARLFDSFEALARSPGMGHRREDVSDPDLRFWTVGDYVIAYRTVVDDIEIVAVTQGARNIPDLLRRRL